MYDAIDGASVIMVVTSWPEFMSLPVAIAPRAHQPLVLDGRRMFDADSVMHYEGVRLGNSTLD